MTARFKSLIRSITLRAACMALFAVALASASSQVQSKCKLTVKVMGIRNTEGNVRVITQRPGHGCSISYSRH